jgi:hypothetical protein
VLDDEGWRELGGAIEALHQRALHEPESKARGAGRTASTTAVVALLLFEHGGNKPVDASDET